MHQHSLSLHFFSIRSKMRRRGPSLYKSSLPLSFSLSVTLFNSLLLFFFGNIFVTSANGIDHEREEEYYRQQQHRRRAEKPKPITLKSIFWMMLENLFFVIYFGRNIGLSTPTMISPSIGCPLFLFKCLVCLPLQQIHAHRQKTLLLLCCMVYCIIIWTREIVNQRVYMYTLVYSETQSLKTLSYFIGEKSSLSHKWDNNDRFKWLWSDDHQHWMKMECWCWRQRWWLVLKAENSILFIL